MEKPKIAGRKPIEVELKKGEDYYWCTCGRSSNQPFCDGSHKETSFTPLKFTVDKDETAHLCTGKQTKNPPYCDGSHNNL